MPSAGRQHARRNMPSMSTLHAEGSLRHESSVAHLSSVQSDKAVACCRFAASLQLNVSGQYNAALAVQSEPAAGWQLLITSGLPAAGVMAPSLQPLTAGTGSYIALQVSDSLGNAVVDPELDFSFTQLLGPQQLNFSSGLLW